MDRSGPQNGCRRSCIGTILEVVLQISSGGVRDVAGSVENGTCTFTPLPAHTRVDKVDEETAKILQICVSQLHKDKVYGLLLPLATGVLEAESRCIG